MITVVGYDGSPLGGRASRALAGATLVLGGARHLAAVAVPPGARTVVMGDVREAVRALTAHGGDSVVLASGDPGFFGIVRRLRAAGLAPDVLPAVTSVAQAFARVGLPWDDALVVSGHGRDPRPALHACRAAGKVAVLTGPGCGPAEVAAAVEGLARDLVVAERLGESDERVVRLPAHEVAGRAWADPNVVLVLRDEGVAAEPGWRVGAPSAPAGWALPEEAFAHRDSMITKAEVRALVLARLAPRLGELVWDVGAGSGSVAVECARFGAAVVAVERDPRAAGDVRHNARRHGVDVRVVEGEAPGVLAALPVPDAVFVGGGGLDVLAGALKLGSPQRVVACFAVLDRVPGAASCLRSAGYPPDGVLLQSSRLAPLPGEGTRLAATNPVFVLWGKRQGDVP